MLRLGKIKVDENEYNAFQRWRSGQPGFTNTLKKHHKFRNYVLLIIVVLTIWFVFGKESFLAFWEWVFSQF